MPLWQLGDLCMMFVTVVNSYQFDACFELSAGTLTLKSADYSLTLWCSKCWMEPCAFIYLLLKPRSVKGDVFSCLFLYIIYDKFKMNQDHHLCQICLWYILICSFQMVNFIVSFNQACAPIKVLVPGTHWALCNGHLSSISIWLISFHPIQVHLQHIHDLNHPSASMYPVI